ncbi:MAG: DUF1015 domain-containing protein [Candidatus Hydrogenedentes bacterium]|nr:DUF1015 domain-containing protein [Candidatus Hydrogenedentota bacterium]
MKLVRGFRGVRYNLKLIGNPDNVIVPPYDVISSELRNYLASLSRYNFVHIDLPEEKEGRNKYQLAGELYSLWKKEGILFKDTSPKAYWLIQQFKDSQGSVRERLALLALVKLPTNEYDKPLIFPHERTFEKPVEDRKLLFEATNSELSPIFFLYSDPGLHLREIFESKVKKSLDSWFSYEVRTVDGVVNTFIVTDWIENLDDLFRDKTFYIADGHHRFKMASSKLREKLEFSHEINDSSLEPYLYVFSAIVAIEDSGLIIYSPHRIVKKFPSGLSKADFMEFIRASFDIIPFRGDSLEKLLEEVNSSIGAPTYGLITKDRETYLIILKKDVFERMQLNEFTNKIHQVCVYPIHRFLFEIVEAKYGTSLDLAYEPNLGKCMEYLERNEAEMVFLLGQISPSIVRECAEAGEFMPQKSTYFFPKIPSGLVVYELDKESL